MDDCVYRVYFIPSCLLLEEDDVPTFLFVSWSNLLLALDVIVAYCLCGCAVLFRSLGLTVVSVGSVSSIYILSLCTSSLAVLVPSGYYSISFYLCDRVY